MKRHLTLFLSFFFAFTAIVYSFERNAFFGTEEELEKYFDKNTDNPVNDSVFSVTQVGKTETWHLSLHLSSIDPDDEIYFNLKKQEIEKVRGNFAGVKSIFYRDEPNKLGPPDESTYDNKSKITFIVKYFITKTAKKDFNIQYERTLKKFKKKDMKKAGRYSLDALDDYYLNHYPIQEDNVDKYNDFGFFLEQSGRYKEAIDLLQKVVKAFPNRTVAYINLGDSYFGANNIEQAKQAYQKYVDLIKKTGKQKKIPKRVYNRLK
ncbi:tetratricopeptide repeat protein [bacterium]|nr:tetratricopeptide repeat protein [bacterium]